MTLLRLLHNRFPSKINSETYRNSLRLQTEIKFDNASATEKTPRSN